MKRKKVIVVSFYALLFALVAGICGCGQTNNVAIAEGMELLAEMDYQGALTAFDTAEQKGEDARLIARGRGIASMGLTEYEEAEDYFLESLALGNGVVENIDYDINYYLAAAYQKCGEYAQAEAVYDAILALRPQEKDAWYLRGYVRLKQENYQGAKEDFDKIVVCEPDNYKRLIQIYEVLSAEGYKSMGVEYLETALDKKSNKMTALDEGCIQYYLGNYEQAQISLEKAKETGDAEAYLYLGMAYEATGDYNYAITNVYGSYLGKNSGNAEIYNQLGLCYMKQEEYALALEAFQSAMKIENSGIIQTLQFNEIITYEYLGEYTQAAVLLDNYLKTYPDDADARREYDFLSTR